MFEIISTLLMLIMLQAVLGFDNLLYISLESKKAPLAKQSGVRKKGILIAIVLRVVLLFILMFLIDFFRDPLFGFGFGEEQAVIDHEGNSTMIKGIFDSHFSGHSLIVLFGGAFILYTAIKEIWHMISNESVATIDAGESRKKKSTNAVITSIVIMNVVFSFDSILAAIGLTKDLDGQSTQLIVMSVAIVISGILMLVLADKVSEFLRKNRLYEVLGLFILLIVGIMLIAEGGHLAHLYILGQPINPMNNATFYFIIFILVIVDLVQGKYQKKISQLENAEEINDIN